MLLSSNSQFPVPSSKFYPLILSRPQAEILKISSSKFQAPESKRENLENHRYLSASFFHSLSYQEKPMEKSRQLKV